MNWETKELLKLSAVHQCQNVMSRYEYYHTCGKQRETVALFANREDVKVEIANLGIYDGHKGLEKFFLGANMQEEDPHREGCMFLHTLTTPVIEVADDLQTAQGVWISPGAESAPNKEDEWCWVKYGVDFIYEEGKWKFWHFHMYRLFKNVYSKSWSECVHPESKVTTYDGEKKQTVSMPPEIAPDRPSAYNWVYSQEAVCELVPAPPEPYVTWNDEQAYVH